MRAQSLFLSVILVLLCAAGAAAAPTITVISGSVTDNALLNESQRADAWLNVTVDVQSIIKLAIDDSYETLVQNGTSAQKSLAGISEGTHTIKVVAIESNNSNATLSRMVDVDVSAPQAAVDFSPSQTTPKKETVVLTWRFTDTNYLSSWIALVDPEGAVVMNQTTADDNYALLKDAVVEGNFTAIYEVKDSAGYLVNGSRQLRVTNDAPTVRLRGPDNATRIRQRSIEVSCEGDDDNLDTLTVYHDNDQSFQAEEVKKANSSQRIYFNLSGLHSETFIWTCAATDTLDKTTFAEENRTIIVDAIEPTISALSPSDGFSTLDKRVTFQWIAQDNAGGVIDCDVVADDERKRTVSKGSGNESETDIEFDPGEHEYFVVCIDEVGNNQTSEVRKFTIEQKEVVQTPETRPEQETSPEPEPLPEPTKKEPQVKVETEPTLAKEGEQNKSAISNVAKTLGGRFTFRKSVYIAGVLFAVGLLVLALMGIREYGRDNIMFRVKMRKYRWMARRAYHKVWHAVAKMRRR